MRLGRQKSPAQLVATVVLDGEALGELRLTPADGACAAVEVTRRGVLRFDLAPEEHLYLTSDGRGDFAVAPDVHPLPIAPGSRMRLRLDAEFDGAGEVTVWVIEYDERQRLRHARAPLYGGGAELDLLVSRQTRALRVLLRLSGRGTLKLSSLHVEPLGLPRALAVDRGRFVAASDVAPRASRPRELPSACPDELPAPGLARDGAEAPIDLYLTVDTEDAYFDQPRMMTGAGLGREWGVNGILDALGERSLPATFFVNVFEAERQPPGAVAAVVREIAQRGHEVGLHTHPSPALEWYDKPLFRKSRDEQVEILKRGRTRLEEWSGQQIISFRAGGYAMNDDTLAALSDAELRIDSSVFFPSPNNHNTRFTINAPALAGDVVEVPVSYVIRSDGGGAVIEHRKLDLDWLTPPEMLEAIARMREAGAPSAMFMMHSFSFIDKATLAPDVAPSPRARFRSGTLFNRYVEIYGPKPQARAAFENFLDSLVQEPRIRLRTLAGSLAELERLAALGAPDIVPVVLRGGGGAAESH